MNMKIMKEYKVKDLFTESALRFFTPFKITDKMMNKSAYPFAIGVYNLTATHFGDEYVIRTNNKDAVQTFLNSMDALGIYEPQNEYQCEEWFKHVMGTI